MPQPYEVHAIRYATRDAPRTSHFVGGDPHDASMPMDYFVWLVRNDQRTLLVDTGFTEEMAAKRQRIHLRCPAAGLKLLGVGAEEITEAVITHMHYDHVGGYHRFPNARFHLQEDEMRFATGRHMGRRFFSHSYEVEEVCGMVRLVFDGRVVFHDGDQEIAPGISLHRIGGHAAGMQCVRVWTRRGWVVLASDTTHYYEHFEHYRVYPTTYHIGEVMDGYDRLRRLADSTRHIVPGHDPLVLERYPAPDPALAGVVARLDAEPSG